MTTLKISGPKVHRAGDGNGAFLYAVMAKTSYGWLTDNDSMLLVLADSDEQAVRYVSAYHLQLTGKFIPLDEQHFFVSQIAERKTDQPVEWC